MRTTSLVHQPCRLDRVRVEPLSKGSPLGEVHESSAQVDLLLAELQVVQDGIRLLDPSADSTVEREQRNPLVVELITTDYRALRELRARQTVIRLSLQFLTNQTNAEGR